MLEVENSEYNKVVNRNGIVSNIKMIFKRLTGTDLRRYNAPTASEIAAVFVANDGAPPAKIDFTISPKDQPLQNINTLSPHCDPMVYPLLFPFGDLGWMPGMQHEEERSTLKNKQMSQLQFYCYR